VKRFSAVSLLGQFVPKSELANRTLADSLLGTFASWLFCFLAHSLPTAFAPWPCRSLELSSPGAKWPRNFRQIFRIGAVHYAEGLWRMRRHRPVTAHCTDSEDFPNFRTLWWPWHWFTTFALTVLSTPCFVYILMIGLYCCWCGIVQLNVVLWASGKMRICGLNNVWNADSHCRFFLRI